MPRMSWRRAAVHTSWPLALGLVACRPDPGGPVEPPSLPPAEVYDEPPKFVGEWVGEVEGTTGTLAITDLHDGRYYGIYEVDGADARYVLRLEQTVIASEDGDEPSNRCLFTWQDGVGGRGTGWLLINREESALTGESVEGDRGAGGGVWTFIRVE